MTVLEDSLRDLFAEQVEEVPPPPDRAAAVIRRGRRIRRGRVAAGALATVVLLIGMVGGLVSLQGWWAPEPARDGLISPILLPPEPATVIDETADPLPWRGGELGVEVRLVNRVWTADGQRSLLRGAGLVEQAYRTPHGLLYGSSAEIRLRQGDTVVDLAGDVDRWLPGPDGRRVAFVSGGTLSVAPLLEDGLGAPARVEVPSGTAPVAFWGERVVLARPQEGTYGVSAPAAPGQPAWSDEVDAVYGPAGEDLVVLVGEPGEHCLALVPAGSDDLRPEAGGGCARPVPVTDDGYGWLSPDGRWLALPTGDEVRLLSVSSPEADPAGAACPLTSHVTPAWRDASTLLTSNETGVVTCTVAGEVAELGRPDGLGSRWEYVPALGVSAVPADDPDPR